MQSLLSKFIDYNPKFIDSLEVFDESTQKKIIKKLKLEKDIQNFRATIAEIQFGQLLNEFNIKIEYEKKYVTNQRPDWTLIENNCDAIVEVYRLGQSSISQGKRDFENEILMTINKIKKPYIIQLTFKNEEFSPVDYDLTEIIYKTKNWISAERQNEDEIVLQNLVVLKVLSNHSKYNHACFKGNLSSIHFKPEKLKQDIKLNPNEITKKLKKYCPLIEAYNIPYFLAVSMDFISGFDFDDFKRYFLGMGVYNADYGLEIPEYPDNKIWGQNWTELGLFYDTPTLSGLILRYNNENLLIINPVRTQVIYDKKNEILLKKLKRMNKSTYSQQWL